MDNATLQARLLMRNDTAGNWAVSNPVLLKGEMGVELDTHRFKFGDGVTVWQSLPYAVQAGGEGGGDMLASLFASNEKASQGYVDRAVAADTLTGTLPLSKIAGLGSAAAKETGTQAGQVPLLDADGKLDGAVLPALALNLVFEAAGEAEMLALDAQAGDMAIRSDESRTYVLRDEPASEPANWIELKTPDCKVVSVNGRIGAVELTSSDVPEGSRLYYTEARAAASFAANLAGGSFILDGGNA